MGELDELPEPGTVPIDPAEPPGAEDSSSFDEGPDLMVIEALAEEDVAPSRDQAEPPAPAAISIAPVLEAVTGLGEHLARRLDSLQALLEREQRAEASRERVVDRLHAELQEYKQDLLLRVQRPIFVDLIQLHDDLDKMIESRAPADADPERAAALRGTLESIQTAIEDILYRQGVEPFSVEGSAFDPRRQRAVSTMATEDPSLNKTIAVRLRNGFQAGEKVIRPEIVSVYTVRQVPSARSSEARLGSSGESEPAPLRST
jgi:molecular chaperone GrpE